MWGKIKNKIKAILATLWSKYQRYLKRLGRLKTWFSFRPKDFRLDYLVLGEARTGTTFLYDSLIQHPEVAPAETKELHFFDDLYWRGLSWYQKQLNFCSDKRVYGEASPYYFSHPLVAGRVRRHFPKVKLVVLLRDPVKRAYSNYNYYQRKGIDQRSLLFEEVIAEEKKNIQEEIKKIQANSEYPGRFYRFYSYLYPGLYCEHLTRWLELFSREQFLFIKSEDLYLEPDKTLQEISRFLGVDQNFGFSFEKSSKNEIDYLPMRPETKEELARYFKIPNEKLYKLIGRDLGWD